MNQEIFNILILLSGFIVILISSLLILMFYRENEIPAIRKTILPSCCALVVILLIYIFNLTEVFSIIAVLVLVFLISMLYPGKINKKFADQFPESRFDERDIMFSRDELQPGSENYLAYYQKNPGLEKKDLRFRKKPGLLSDSSRYYHEEAFMIARSNFTAVDKLHPRVQGKPADHTQSYNNTEISRQLKKEALKSGALNAGICKTKAYHFYSFKGRGDEYGYPIELKHQFAIAFTVEMDQIMVSAAPKAAIVAESSRQYLSAGKIAIKIAEQIREMGYDARAHIDGNYQVICPLIARDAGLGEIGRMGLLLTPDQGPRVRIGVVTTNMPLVKDHYKRDYSLIDFCRICSKCSDCCPSASIPHGDPILINKVRRWKINSEACFTYWCEAGTDCGRCLAVCPYAHPNHSLHKLVRIGIRHSALVRHIAYMMDNYFYGKKPEIQKSDTRWENRMRELNHSAEG